MDHAIVFVRAVSISRLVAIAAAAWALIAVVSSGVAAQTLTDPIPQTKSSSPPAVPKSPPTGHVKSCSAYGAGFVNVAGTDACVKIGGYVGVEVTSSPAR
jgi:hypothetical protein